METVKRVELFLLLISRNFALKNNLRMHKLFSETYVEH